MRRNQYITFLNHPVTMASKMVSIGTDSDKELLIDSTRKLNTITANQETVVILTMNAALKHNSVFLFMISN